MIRSRFLASSISSTVGSELTGPLLDSLSSGFLGGRSLMRSGDDGTAGADGEASIWVFNSLVSDTISSDIPYLVYGYLYITDQRVLRQSVRPMSTGPKAFPNSLKNGLTVLIRCGCGCILNSKTR
jgi:hypothetical protein